VYLLRVLAGLAGAGWVGRYAYHSDPDDSVARSGFLGLRFRHRDGFEPLFSRSHLLSTKRLAATAAASGGGGGGERFS
jgi:hypothetical protein